jgi:hypothetical protein
MTQRHKTTAPRMHALSCLDVTVARAAAIALFGAFLVAAGGSAAFAYVSTTATGFGSGYVVREPATPSPRTTAAAIESPTSASETASRLQSGSPRQSSAIADLESQMTESRLPSTPESPSAGSSIQSPADSHAVGPSPEPPEAPPSDAITPYRAPSATAPSTTALSPTALSPTVSPTSVLSTIVPATTASFAPALSDTEVGAPAQ